MHAKSVEKDAKLLDVNHFSGINFSTFPLFTRLFSLPKNNLSNWDFQICLSEEGKRWASVCGAAGCLMMSARKHNLFPSSHVPSFRRPAFSLSTGHPCLTCVLFLLSLLALRCSSVGVATNCIIYQNGSESQSCTQQRKMNLSCTGGADAEIYEIFFSFNLKVLERYTLIFALNNSFIFYYTLLFPLYHLRS